MRFLQIVVFLLFASLGSICCDGLRAQAPARVRASEVFPLQTGQLTAYQVFTTDTTGIPIASSESYASTRVASSTLTFDGKSNVSLVLDTTSARTPQTMSVNDVHYVTDAAGDIHAFADANFLELFAPATVAKTLTPPDSFVNYFILSEGDKPYHMFSLNQDVPYQSLTISIAVEMSGEFRGIEKITVPGGSFDSAYHFTITANVTGSSKGYELMRLMNAEEFWLVRGIGIIKTNMPSVNKGLVQIIGSQREMTGHWIETTHSSVAQFAATNPSMAVFPNPASNSATLILTKAGAIGPASLNIFNIVGIEVLRVRVPANATEYQLDTKSLPTGNYFLYMHQNTGAQQLLRLTISH